MSAMKKYAALSIYMLALATLAAGCDEDSSYDQRTVVYVSNINDGMPFMSDVLHQGDSLYYSDTMIFKLEDDFIEEDWIKIEIHNRPYNSIVEPGASLGDFLITSYEVSFVRDDGGAVPVRAFRGEMSTHVPANSKVEAYIVLVPLVSKTIEPLVSMQYSNNEIFSNARLTFRGHEIQTNREIAFSAGLHVNFADPLIVGRRE